MLECLARGLVLREEMKQRANPQAQRTKNKGPGTIKDPRPKAKDLFTSVESAARLFHIRKAALTIRERPFGKLTCLRLLQFKASRDQVGLITNTRETVSQAGKMQHVGGARIALQEIQTTHHRLARLSEFI